MFSHGQVYKYNGARKLDALLTYAKGGFKKDESRDVPLPFDFTTALKDVVQGVVKDVNGIKRGEAPGRTTLGLLLAAGFVLIFLLSFVMPSPRPVKKKAASRVKAD
ncbi:unnamed protein product [Sphacelaria rigidula]